MSMSQPDAESILAKVVEVTAKVLDVDKEKLSPASNFTEDLGADSLSRVELWLALENEFQIDVEPQEVNKILSIGDATQYLTMILRANQNDDTEAHRLSLSDIH